MKTIKLKQQLFSIALLAALFLTSCDKDESTSGIPADPDNNSEIRFEIGFAPTSRAATDAAFNTSWEDGDQIGLFVVSRASGTSKSLSSTSANNYYNNVKLIYNSATQEWTTPGGLYFNGNDVLDFYAYYPYRATATNPLNIIFNVHANQAGVTSIDGTDKSNFNLSDLLTAKANNGGNGYRKGEKVTLQFAHALSMIELDISDKFASVPDYIDGKLIVRLKGMKTETKLNLGTTIPSITATTTINDVIMTRVTDVSDRWIYRAIVAPQELTSNSWLFHIEQDDDNIPGKSGSNDFNIGYRADTDMTFAGNNVYPFRLKIEL